MTKIILACAAGMSTSLLVNKMKEVAEAENIEASIKAIPEAEISQHLNECDVILLGPQVKFMIDEIRAIANATLWNDEWKGSFRISFKFKGR